MLSICRANFEDENILGICSQILELNENKYKS